MRTFLLLALALTAVAAAPSNNYRIIGGTVTNIGQYPYAVALLASSSGSGTFSLACGGSIINNRSILSAAHCFLEGYPQAWQWRGRVGSTNAHSGGALHNINQIINHPQYNQGQRFNNDVAIMRVSSTFSYNNNVQPGSIAGPNYFLADNKSVWAIGWGRTSTGLWAPTSEQLRHVQVLTVSQSACRSRYGQARITDGMLCSGWLDVGGRDQCGGDSGGPLLDGNVIVGVCSWGQGCASPIYPGVNARVTTYSSWISNNA